MILDTEADFWHKVATKKSCVPIKEKFMLRANTMKNGLTTVYLCITGVKATEAMGAIKNCDKTFFN